MKEIRKKSVFVALISFSAFIGWTLALCFVNVEPIGPLASKVAFATLNGYVHSFFGVHMLLYTVTDWLGLVPFVLMFGFAALGAWQWIKRKSILRVDRSLLALGGFYTVLAAIYLLFESFIINYRPVLIDGALEASYPSSTTLLVICVTVSAVMQFRERIKNKKLLYFLEIFCALFIAFMVVGRLISGVHWVTDIIGGILCSSFLLSAYYSIAYSGR